MNNLIKVQQNEKGDLLVNARDLYDSLKVQQDFTDWIKKQLSIIESVNDLDYYVYWCKNDDLFKRVSVNDNINSMTRKGYRQDYILKLDIAKEICMVVGVAPRTNKETKELSKKVRKYFIECERQLKIQITNNKELYNIIVDLKKKYKN